MSIQTEIDRLNAIKERIRTNLVAQGVTIPADTMLTEMAEQILSVAGEDGISCTHSWTGSTLTVTSASGTSSADLRGYAGLSFFCVSVAPIGIPDGDGVFEFSELNNGYRNFLVGDLILSTKNYNLYKVIDVPDSASVLVEIVGNIEGPVGANGTSVTIENVVGSTVDGGTNVVTFSDGNTLSIKNGNTGERGFSVLRITTAPSSYTTATGGFTPKYRIALSTVLTQSNATKVLVGDTLKYSYYEYPIGYVDASYVYLGTRVPIRGATGAAGATPVKGTDYFTDADKTEMVAQVQVALPYIVIEGLDTEGDKHTWTVFGYVGTPEPQ